MNIIYSTVNTLRDRYTPVSHTSTFRETGQITPEEFVAAGDYLVFKFPTWSWADADPESKRVSYLPAGKQFLITRNVPCERRLNENFAGDAGLEEAVVKDGDDFNSSGGGNDGSKAGDAGGDDDGWLRTGGLSSSQPLKAREVRTVDDAGNAGERAGGDDDDDDIPDMEDEEDEEAIIKDTDASGKTSGRRTYTLYIMYSPYYRTPRVYLSGYSPDGQPLPPPMMMEDVMGDYKDKTVTPEDFPFFAAGVKMASIHPCKHAPVMKTLLDRADSALRLRRERLRAASASAVSAASASAADGVAEGLEGLHVSPPPPPPEGSGSGGGALVGKGDAGAAAAADAGNNDGWEDIQHVDVDEASEVAIRVDQYLVVFLKFIASVTPGIEHDFTMGV